ncbi:RTA1-domain-containing protein [Mycena leptocephala]|nr:RTA1-domain-containing protein [Mycena leptocephala]
MPSLISRECYIGRSTFTDSPSRCAPWIWPNVLRILEYGYVPHEYVAVLFISLFGLSTLLHIGQAKFYRMWWLFPTICLCGIGELIGWSGRLWSSFSPNLHDPFMMQVVSTVISPTPLIAVNFVLLSWIVTQLGPCYARLSPTSYTVVFVTSDVVALLVQAAGGSIASGANDSLAHSWARISCSQESSSSSLHSMCTAASLPISLAVYNDHPLKIRTSDRRALTAATRRMICALAFSTLLLFIRSIYRIIELGSGWHGRIMRTERYFIVLDGGMVLLAMLSMNFAHPGYLLGPRRPQPPTEYGMKVIGGERQSESEGFGFA